MSAYDLIVIGGGPSGSTLASFVAMGGHRVLLLEKERFPRHQIGESLLPATVHQMADLLGITARLRSAGFIVKRGATFSWGTKPDTLWTMNFGRLPADQVELPPDAPFAYNVPRHQFDQMLLENAMEKGVDVRQPCAATALISENGRVCGVRFTDEHGSSQEARAAFVCVTTGQIAMPGRVVGPREYSVFFRKVGVFGYYEGAGHLQFPLDGNTFFSTSGDAWLWHIPLSNTLTSIGAVIPAKDGAKVKANPREALDHYISGSPIVAELLRDARPATTEPFVPVRLRSEYSYCRTSFWSPGVCVVGDAACFVDVLLSSGVHLATYGALLAARSINSILAGAITEAHGMNEFETRLRLEYGIFYRGLVGLYDMNCTSDAYAVWLRSLLQDTNGVYVEWRERSSPSAIQDASADVVGRGASNVEAMRAYNAAQVRYDGSAGMFNNPPPPIRFTLSASSDWLRWAAPVPDPANPLAPDPEVGQTSAVLLAPGSSES
jgi:FAD-dependent halogenase